MVRGDKIRKFPRVEKMLPEEPNTGYSYYAKLADAHIGFSLSTSLLEHCQSTGVTVKRRKKLAVVFMVRVDWTGLPSPASFPKLAIVKFSSVDSAVLLILD